MSLEPLIFPDELGKLHICLFGQDCLYLSDGKTLCLDAPGPGREPLELKVPVE